VSREAIAYRRPGIPTLLEESLRASAAAARHLEQASGKIDRGDGARIAAMNPQPAARDRTITGDELLAMGDIGPCELVDGRIVPMSPTGHEHGYLELRLGGRLAAFVADRQLGWVSGGEVGIYTRRDPDRVRGADIVFVSRERLPNRPDKRFIEVAPELVVEIISPEDRWQDVRQKIEEYFAIGVATVWIVEPANAIVLVYRSPTDVTRLGTADVLEGSGTLTGFAIAVRALFGE
jgi:Uma2 family endonuclease